MVRHKFATLLTSLSTHLASFKRYETALLSAADRARKVQPGKLPDYIPLLRHANLQHLAISIALPNGKVISVGDSTEAFSVQSVGKVFSYAKLVETLGAKSPSEILEMAPSPYPFNSLELAPTSGKPFNPMVNTGALAVWSHLLASPERVTYKGLLEFASKLAGTQLRDLPEEASAALAVGEQNSAIVRMLQEKGLLAAGVSPEEVLDAYYQQCFILMNTESLAKTALNLAINPKYQFLSDALLDYGLYNFSAEWKKRVGIPAKSSVSGVIMGVIPRKMGIAIYAPGLDSSGNSVRGIEAAEYLSKALGLFHQNLREEP